jgi:hypothetical protein
MSNIIVEEFPLLAVEHEVLTSLNPERDHSNRGGEWISHDPFGSGKTALT